MKKITYIFAVLIAGLTLFSSCENEPLTGEFFQTPDGSDPADFCADAPGEIAEAQAALSSAPPNQQAELCDALQASITATISFCGDPGGALQALLNQLGDDCNVATNGGDDDDNDGNGDDDDGDGNDDSQVVIGETYQLTSITTTTALDLNGDGEATTDYLTETECLDDERLFFNDETTVAFVSTSFLDVVVGEDMEGNLVQEVNCTLEDTSTPTTYIRDATVIIIDDSGEDLVGTISGDQIIFIDSNFFVGEFITDDGMGTFELEEEVTIVYTRI